MHEATAAKRTYLDQFPAFRGTDPEEVRNDLSRAYGAQILDSHLDADGFRAIGNHVQLQSVGLSYCSFGAPVQVHFPAANFVRQQFQLRGYGATAIGNKKVAVKPDQSCVISEQTDVVVDFCQSFEQLVLRVDAHTLQRKLTALIGSKPASPLQFESSANLNDRNVENLRQLTLHFANLLSATRVGLPRLVMEELQQSIVMAFICCNRHNFSQLLDEEPKESAPWQVKRVEDYIEARWSSPITIEKLTTITNTSARSIFKAFKNSREYTPMEFAKQVRLKHARAMFLLPQSNTAVSGVALACGFSNLGHFAKDYRQAFGELPSVTLSRGRRVNPL